MRRLRRDCSVLLLAVAATGVLAAPADDKPHWFQVDMAIFTYLSDAAQSAEAWPNNLHLRYPESVERLMSPEDFAAAACAPAYQELPGSGYRRQSIEAGVAITPASSPSGDCTPPDDATILGRTAATPAQAGADTAAAAPIPFVLLRQGDPEMAEVLNKLKRSYRYHPVFSGSWVQALENRQQSPAILIRGGDAYGRHQELEGFIKVSLERYLHLNTDLWLSRFTRVETAPAYSLYGAARVAYTSGADNGPQWPPLPTPPEPAARTGAESIAADTNAVTAEEDAYEDMPAMEQPQVTAMTPEIQDDFRVARTVVMKQSRRMRSGEIHYLDHPLFGVLVKITPLDLSDSELIDDAPIGEIPPG